MSLQSRAQEQLFVVDPAAITPLEVSLPLSDHEVGSLEMGADRSPEEIAGTPALEVHEPIENLEIEVGELPGAPPGTKDPEPVLEVAESPMQVSEMPAADDNEAKKSKNEKWDWSKHGTHGFINWIKERIDSVPKHSGYDSAGLERAMSYMEKLDSEISKAMRMDLDGELDANKIEEVRAKIDDGVARLQNRLDKVKESKKSSKKRKKSAADLSKEAELLQSFGQADVEDWITKTSVPGEEWTVEKALQQMAEYYGNRGIVKEAQKILGVQGVYIMAPLLIASIARICVNGTISAGHDIEDLYKRQVSQWKLSDREQFELRNLLFDMGFPLRFDRGINPEVEYDVASSDNMDWAANYKG